MLLLFMTGYYPYTWISRHTLIDWYFAHKEYSIYTSWLQTQQYYFIHKLFNNNISDTFKFLLSDFVLMTSHRMIANVYLQHITECKEC